MTLLQSFRGDTATFPIDVTGIDLEFAEVTFTAKRTFNGPVFVQKTLDDGITPPGSGDTDIVVIIEPEDTGDLTHTERFVWDVQVDDGLEIITAAHGRWVVMLDVTRPTGSGS